MTEINVDDFLRDNKPGPSIRANRQLSDPLRISRSDLKDSNFLAVQDFEENLNRWKKKSSNQNISRFSSSAYTRIEGMTGKLTLVLGPMGSGKSEQCIQDNKIQRRVDKVTMVVKPMGEKRLGYEQKYLTTHNDKQGNIPVFVVENLEELMTKYEEQFKQAHVIQIDEFHFFTHLSFVNVIFSWILKGYEIYLYGLNASYQMKPFGQSLGELVSIAKHVITKTAICEYCKTRTAHWTDRVNKTHKDLYSAGGLDEYKPCCMSCYIVVNELTIQDKKETNTTLVPKLFVSLEPKVFETMED